jgi:hypothetical protein
MKYLKVYEFYTETEQLLNSLRQIARKIISAEIELADKNGIQTTWEDYLIVFDVEKNANNKITILSIDVYQNGGFVGTIIMDFNNPKFPFNIIVEYKLGKENERYSTNSESKTELFEKNLKNMLID